VARGDDHDASCVPLHQRASAPKEEPARGAPVIGIPVSSVVALSAATALRASSRLVSALSCSVFAGQMAMSRCWRAGPSEPSDPTPELLGCSLSCPKGGERRALQGPEAVWRRATGSPTNDEKKLRPLVAGVKSEATTPSSTVRLDRAAMPTRCALRPARRTGRV